MKENMKLWESVCTTDPAITKYVDQRGGFTAIDAQAQLKRATELWGSYGMEWGVKDLKYEYVTGKEGGILEVVLTADFFYPTAKECGVWFTLSTDMAYKPGNDSRKKLLTDLTTKALSKLGFNSDVFEGKFDDNKYVQELKKAPPVDIKKHSGVDQSDHVPETTKKKVQSTNEAQVITNKAMLIKVLSDEGIEKGAWKDWLMGYTKDADWGPIDSVSKIPDDQIGVVLNAVKKNIDKIRSGLPF